MTVFQRECMSISAISEAWESSASANSVSCRQRIPNTSVGCIALGFRSPGRRPGGGPNRLELIQRQPSLASGIQQHETSGRCLLELGK